MSNCVHDEWLATSVLADGKFIAIFAMLLGASLVLLPGRASDCAMPAWRVHVRRMAARLVLEILHQHPTSYCPLLHCRITYAGAAATRWR